MWLRGVSRSVRYSEPSNLGAAIDDERRLRERRIEEHRASLEYEKLASCTFQPASDGRLLSGLAWLAGITRRNAPSGRTW